VAVHQAGKHLMNVHMRDIDGLMRLFVHVGEGVMDFRAIAEALKAVGFTGFLSLEQDGLPGDMKTTCARYLAMMKGVLSASVPDLIFRRRYRQPWPAEAARRWVGLPRPARPSARRTADGRLGTFRLFHRALSIATEVRAMASTAPSWCTDSPGALAPGRGAGV
jgi:hypothetical protein